MCFSRSRLAISRRISRGLIIFLAMAGNLFAQAQWVHFGANGTLAYYADNATNRIPDFSYAGYEGGGVPLPTLPVKVTLSPISGDNTAQIQAAINAVSALTPDANGFRGAVLLQTGTYSIAGTLSVSAGGVVLRGQGNNTNNGTVLLVTGTSRNVITVGGSSSVSQVGSSYTITNNYVPLGATNFNVASAAAFAVGNLIVVQRPQTQVWINAVGMSNYWTPNSGLHFERTIIAINGNQITVDIPLCNPIEQTWATGAVYRISDTARIQQCGIENLAAVGQISDYPSNILSGTFAVYQNIKNAWMHDVLMSGWGNGASLNGGAKWCTVQDCQYTNPATGTASAAPAAYTIGDGDSMCLVQRCTSDGGYYHIMATQAGTAGPNVFLNFTCSGTHYNGGPHQRWAVGELFDNINMAADRLGTSTPYLAINNRGADGSGQGFGAGFSLMYNCQVPQFQLEQPAVTNHYNWTIGGLGSVKQYGDNGIYDDFGILVAPHSLYLEQLKERLGGASVENIGYQLFAVSVTPRTQTAVAGGNTVFTAMLGATNGFNNVVAFSVSGLPTGATPNFSANAITNSGSATLTINTIAATPVGSYPLVITGGSGNVVHTATVILTVNPSVDFSLAATPPSQTVNGGSGASYAVTITATNGFASNIVLSASGLPANSTASFNPPSVNGSGSSTMSVTTANNTPFGTYPVSITGTSGTLVSATAVNFTVGRNPANLRWYSTSSTTWDVTNSYNWFNSNAAVTDQFYQGDTALLDDTPGIATTLTLAAGVAVQPAALTNNSSVNNFAITGSGKISGAAAIVKSGTSTLTLGTSNDFTGGVMILAGILQANNSAALGAASGLTFITNTGTLDINGLNLSSESVSASGPGTGNVGAIINSGAAQTTALKNVMLTGDTTLGGAGRWDIRGSGASLLTGGHSYNLTKVGPNQVSLVAVNPIDTALGNIDIQQGEFAIQTTTTQVGNPAKTITVHSNATLEVWALSASPLNKVIVLNDGATLFNESGSSIITGPLTLQGSNTFNIGGTSLTFNNALSGPGNLNKSGAGIMILGGTNLYTGSTLISSGLLALTNLASISNSTNITISSGATLNVNGRSDGTLTLASGQTLQSGLSGVLSGNILVSSGATLSPGGAGAIGALTVTGSVTLLGNNYFELNKSGGAPTNDALIGSTNLSYGGTLTLAILNGDLAAGDSFQLFNAAKYSGAFTNLIPATPGDGLAWDTSSLTINGTLNVVLRPRLSGITVSGTNLLFSVANGAAGSTYYLLAATNLTLPFNHWTFVATNTLDSNGTFLFTNGLDASLSQRYYLLAVP